jgi:hypothetical protein
VRRGGGGAGAGLRPGPRGRRERGGLSKGAGADTGRRPRLSGSGGGSLSARAHGQPAAHPLTGVLRPFRALAAAAAGRLGRAAGRVLWGVLPILRQVVGQRGPAGLVVAALLGRGLGGPGCAQGGGGGGGG